MNRWKLVLRLVNLFFRYSPRVEMLNKAMGYVRASNLKGDYLEFGVYKGSTFAAAYHSAKWMKCYDMRFYAFDSFKGLPNTQELELESNPFYEGQYACSVSDFKKNIKSKGVDLSKVKIVEGWFAETLHQDIAEALPVESIAIAWVDCDYYESAILVLNFIVDYLIDGTILVFDDWFLFKGSPNYGEQRAVREWLAQNKEIELVEYHKFGCYGNSFIVRKVGVE